MNDRILDSLFEVTEELLDSLISNEVIKAIPMLNMSVGIAKETMGIRDRFFLKKIQRFTFNIGQLNQSQIDRIKSQYNESEKRKTKIDDALITAIEQSDSELKIDYISAVFKAFVEGEFGHEDLRLYYHTIKSVFVEDLKSIIEEIQPTVDLKYLVPSGLAEAEYRTLVMDGRTEPDYKLSSVAMSLKDIWKNHKPEK